MVGASRHRFFENAFTHLFDVESPTPRSAETCRPALSLMLRIDCQAMVQAAGQRDACRSPFEFLAVSVCHVWSA
jgi:hypothetical protein